MFYKGGFEWSTGVYSSQSAVILDSGFNRTLELNETDPEMNTKDTFLFIFHNSMSYKALGIINIQALFKCCEALFSGIRYTVRSWFLPQYRSRGFEFYSKWNIYCISLIK